MKQAERLLVLDSPLPPDELIAMSFEGTEEMSRLFSYRLRVISPRRTIEPAELLGRGITVLVRRDLETGDAEPETVERSRDDYKREVASGERRPFHGIVKSLLPGSMWGRGYRQFEIEMVPWLWFLDRTSDIRIFQKMTTKEILEQVLQGARKSGKVEDLGFKREFDLAGIKGGFEKRDYCVQYRETDFNFVSRLMEEEGIYYYFKHAFDSHRMILANTPQGHFDCADPKVEFRRQDHVRPHVHEWKPRFETKTGKWRLKDFDFKKPSTDLTASRNTVLKPPAFKPYEVYDYPGGYETTSEGQRFASLRMQEHEAGYRVIDSACDLVSFSPGARFDLVERVGTEEELRDLPPHGDEHEYHYEEVLDTEYGPYVITAITHTIVDPSHGTSESDSPLRYENRFTCIPLSVPFRPASITPKPVVRGPQTATVVGPAGEEIYTDEFGRIKVQFHWDREGEKNEDSSCWVRVAQTWAGRQWGTIYIPRIGHEVVVDFLEGDPDHPIIIGSMYNAENMPPYGLPGSKTQSGLKTRSSLGGGGSDFNELRFEDKAGSEEVYFHAQKNFVRYVEHDDKLDVRNDQTITIKQNRTETLEMGNDKVTLKMGNRTTKLNLGADSTEAMQKIELKVGQSSITIDQLGITLKGMMIKINGTIMTDIKAGALLTLKGPITMIN